MKHLHLIASNFISAGNTKNIKSVLPKYKQYSKVLRFGQKQGLIQKDITSLLMNEGKWVKQLSVALLTDQMHSYTKRKKNISVVPPSLSVIYYCGLPCNILCMKKTCKILMWIVIKEQ
jgi:hypothetical protein